MKLYQHKVQYYETDKMGIVHHSNYIRWMEEARMDFLGQIGWAYDKIEESGIISPVTSVQCKYLKTTTFSNLIKISVIVEEFRSAKLKLKYEMKNEADEIVCVGHSEHCFLKDGRIINVKREYPEFHATLIKYIQ